LPPAFGSGGILPPARSGVSSTSAHSIRPADRSAAGSRTREVARAARRRGCPQPALRAVGEDQSLPLLGNSPNQRPGYHDPPIFSSPRRGRSSAPGMALSPAGVPNPCNAPPRALHLGHLK
jgi:hypothetical protein